jgi:hypothetical protein
MRQRINTRAYENLCLLGVSPDDASYIVSNANSLLVAAVREDDEGVRDIGNYLERAIVQTGIGDVLYNPDPLLTCRQAFSAVYREVSRGRVVGITGKPGSGKSSFLRDLSLEGGIAIFDEFWNAIEGYDEKRDELDSLAECRLPIAVAACHVDRGAVDICFHIEADPKKRAANLLKRDDGPSDRLRARYFSAFERHDDILFGLEKIHAEYIFDSGSLSF